MRLLLIILFSYGVAQGQIINASRPYVSAASFPLLLDAYTGADVAYSLKLIRTAYAGACLRIRRSSDNTEQDINFVNGFCDTASLLSFVGANDGYVTTWYDQSGNARNAVQATAANQPQLVASGVLRRIQGKPAVYFGTQSNHWFLLLPSGYLNAATTISYYQVVHAIAYQPNQNSALFGPNNNAGVGFEVLQSQVGTGGITRLRVNGTIRDNNSAGTDTAYLWNNGSNSITSIYGNSTSMAAYKNNGSQALEITTAMPSLNYNGQYAIGTFAKNFGTIYNMSGYFLELVIYPTNQSSNHTQIVNIINSVYQIF